MKLNMTTDPNQHSTQIAAQFEDRQELFKLILFVISIGVTANALIFTAIWMISW